MFYYRHATNLTRLPVSCITSFKDFRVKSTSSSVLPNPSEKRTEQWASSSDKPSSINVDDGAGFPDLQADPEEK